MCTCATSHTPRVGNSVEDLQLCSQYNLAAQGNGVNIEAVSTDGVHYSCICLGTYRTVVFAYLNGFGSTAKLLDHYLVQKDLKRPSDRESWYQLHQREFRMFGAVVFALNLVPVANWLFVFTNTVGAALYAADIERNGTFIKGTSHEEVSSLAALKSTISQVQSSGSSPMTRSQKAAHRINVSHQ